MEDDKFPGAMKSSPGLQRWKAAGSQVMTLGDLKRQLSPRPPPGARPSRDGLRLDPIAAEEPNKPDADARSDAESYGSNKPKNRTNRRSRELDSLEPTNNRRSRELSDSPTQNSSGSGERSESPASAALAYYKGWAVEGLDDLAKLGSTRKKKSSSPHRHGHRKSATSPLAGGATTICSASPTSPLAPTGFSPGSSPSFGRPDSPKMPPMGAAGGATVISTLSGSVLSGLNSSSLSARTPDDEDDSASIASGGSYAPSLAMSTASRGSIGSSYSRISASVPGQRKSPRGLQRQDSGACNSLAAQHRRRQRELNSPSEVGGARRRGSIRRGAPALTEATQEEEKAAANSSQNVDHLLNNVMRAYANLELSGVDDKQLGSLAQALGKNAALKSINLSHNKQIEKSGIVALAGGLAANSSVTSLNLSGCANITDDAAAELIRILSETQYVMENGRERPRPPCTLATLVLSSCPRVGDRFAASLASSMVVPGADESGHGHLLHTHADDQMLTLKNVNLSGARALSDNGVHEIAKALKSSTSLTVLSLQGCTRVGDEGVASLAEALSYSPALQELDLSWCELTDASAASLSACLAENRYLKTLRLACCVEMTDEATKAFGQALGQNATLTCLDLGWCTKLRDLHSLYNGLLKNQRLTNLILTGTPAIIPKRAPKNESTEDRIRRREQEEAAAKREAEEKAAANDEKGRRGSIDSTAATPAKGGNKGAPTPRRDFGPDLLASVNSLLHRNRTGARRGSVGGLGGIGGAGAMGLGGGGGGGDDARVFGLRTANQSSEEVQRMVRAAIVTGAAMYNTEDGEGAFELFVSTAESVVAATSSGEVAAALQQATSHNSGLSLQMKLWAIRSAFDQLLDNLDEQQQMAAAATGEPPKTNNDTPPIFRRFGGPNSPGDGSSRRPRRVSGEGHVTGRISQENLTAMPGRVDIGVAENSITTVTMPKKESPPKKDKDTSPKLNARGFRDRNDRSSTDRSGSPLKPAIGR